MIEPLPKDPPRRTRDPEAKRKQLLASARALFVELGFDDTTTKRIAAHAGVSEGVVFHQFGSKQGLFSALVKAFSADGAREFLPADQAEIDPEAVVRNALAFAERDRELFQMIVDNQAKLRDNGVPTLRDYVVPLIEAELRRSIDAGLCYPGDPKLMAQFQFSIVETVLLTSMTNQNKKAKEALVQEAIRSMQAVSALPGR